MRYYIEYKVKAVRRGGWLFSKSNLFPRIEIRYRESGAKRWINLGRAEIDKYTYRRFKNTYYKDFENNGTDLMTLEQKSDYERLELFMDVLRTEYCNSITSFVESIVREEITMNRASSEERKDVNRLTCSIVTGDFEKTSINI